VAASRTIVVAGAGIGGLTASLALARHSAQLDLTLLAAALDDGSLAVALQYSTDLFDAPTIERLAARAAHIGTVYDHQFRTAGR